MDILIDYFGATFKELELADLIEYLGLQNVNWLEGKGCNGWQRHDYYNGIHLYSCGRDDIGIELSGVGCRTLETLNELSFDWLALFCWVSNFGDSANVFRLDVAGDEKEGILNFNTLVNHTRAGKYVSKARKRIWIDGDEHEIMFGASTSSTRLRIYDKANERKVDGHWMRCEMQMRDEAADRFIANFISYGDIGVTYGGVLLNYLQYTTKAPESLGCHHYENLKTTKWWSKFIGTSQKIHSVTVGGLEYNCDSLHAYMKQCASSIRTYVQLFGSAALLELAYSTQYSAKQKELLSRMGVSADG